ncbi:hypothetical protein Tco_1189106 [Tanacetum coccineum]
MGDNNKIALARFRIANLEQIIEDIQADENTRVLIRAEMVRDQERLNGHLQADDLKRGDQSSRISTHPGKLAFQRYETN